MEQAPKLEFHPEAARAFNEEAETLVRAVEPQPQIQARKPSFRPDISVAANIAEKDLLGEIRVGLSDGFGNPTGQFFHRGNELVGLVGQGFKSLMKLAERIQSTASFRDKISTKCVADLTMFWVEKRYRDETTVSLTHYLLAECALKVKPFEIWVPLFHLHLEEEIRLGNVEFKTITRQMLDDWDEWRLEHAGGDVHALREHFSKERKRLQATTAAVVRLQAESTFAYDQAFGEAQKAAALLSFFHPANLAPRARAFCAPVGSENARTSMFLLIDDGKIRDSQRKSLYRGNSAWFLDKSHVAHWRQNGLEELSALFGSNDRTPFQNDLLNALILYSKNVFAEDVADKLVPICVALESMLLRNNMEPIAQNLADRMAFLIGTTKEKRKSIQKNIKDAYGLRSRFLHHGYSIEEMEAVQEFMVNAWSCFLVLILDAKKFNTKQELLGALEDRKLA